jgi:hypothetical protein
MLATTCENLIQRCRGWRMRDRLVYHYFDINLDVLWSTVTHDLPRLLAILSDNLVPDRSALTARDQRRPGER